MPVYLHLANLIVDKAAVASKYTGVIEHLRLAAIHHHFCLAHQCQTGANPPHTGDRRNDR